MFLKALIRIVLFGFSKKIIYHVKPILQKNVLFVTDNFYLQVLIILCRSKMSFRSKLAPNNTKADEKYLCEKLNSVNWAELGSVCDGRHLFSQKSLENSLLPDFFEEDIYREPV